MLFRSEAVQIRGQQDQALEVLNTLDLGWLSNLHHRSDMAQAIYSEVSWRARVAKAHQVLLPHHNNQINKARRINKCHSQVLLHLHLHRKHHPFRAEDILGHLRMGIQATHHRNQPPHQAQAKVHA